MSPLISLSVYNNCLIQFIKIANHWQMKQNFVPNHESVPDHMERLSPLEKIISTENLSYIPNLYFRKYKLIEALNHERFDFPEQKIIVPRPKTSWDALLCQVKEKAELRKEIQKYKIAQNFHVAKTAKEEFIKKELKKQQRQLFHRIVANQLSEEVFNYFKAQNSVAPEQTNGQSEKNGQTELKKSDSMNRGRGMDDIFIDNKPEEDYLGVDNGGDIDFFDDILNDGMQNKTPLDLMNEPGKVEQTAPQRTVKDYVDSYNKMLENNEENQMQEEISDPVPSHVSRKACLKRINQNIRRRLKTKGAQEEDRSLASATVALSNLINHYPQCKEIQNFVQIPSTTEWIFDDSVKNKKRRDEQFTLNWDEEEIQRFEQMNQKFEFSKIKDSQAVLQLTVQKSEFPKVFERNIATNFNFPSNIASIKSFTAKFNQKKFYYNEFFDYDYERFVRKNNKRKLLQKFEKNSNYMFAQHYVQYEIGNDQKVSIGKMFLHSQSKISDRLIYKVTPGTSKISIVAKDYNRKNVPLSREKIILLSYLVNRYLTEFGNNWKTITEFIEIFPCFSNYIIKPELVQEFYQMINRHELKVSHLENMEIWDKKLLPSNQIYSSSYKDFSKIVKERALNKKLTIDNEMIDESLNTADVSSEESNNFSLDNYENFLKQPLTQKSQKKSIFQNLSSKYKNYGLTLRAQTTNETYNFYENKIRKANKIIEEYRNTYGVTKVEASEKSENQERVLQYVQENMKGDVKNGLPFRKKKNINQRNNELVKILQALRSKNTTNMPPQGGQKMPVDMSKQSQSIQPKPPMVQPQSNPQIAPLPPAQTTSPKPVDASQAQKEQKKSKTPEKRVSGAGNINKKPKKKQGEQDKEKK